MLNARLSDADRAIGPSYLMKANAAHPEGLELIWRTQILPLLEDQLYGTGIDVAEEYGLAALGDTLHAAAAAVSDIGRPSSEEP
ncbi:hypothetical protein ACR6C2_05200 [Streptomyces sp. INA 01156]